MKWRRVFQKLLIFCLLSASVRQKIRLSQSLVTLTTASNSAVHIFKTQDSSTKSLSANFLTLFKFQINKTFIGKNKCVWYYVAGSLSKVMVTMWSYFQGHCPRHVPRAVCLGTSSMPSNTYHSIVFQLSCCLHQYGHLETVFSDSLRDASTLPFRGNRPINIWNASPLFKMRFFFTSEIPKIIFVLSTRATKKRFMLRFVRSESFYQRSIIHTRWYLRRSSSASPNCTTLSVSPSKVEFII